MKKAVIFGSSVVDVSARSPHMPSPGQTVKGSAYTMNPGGKGFNQAVACHKAGGDVFLITKWGADPLSRVPEQMMDELGMSKAHIFRDKSHPTGVALITVDESTAQNQIVVVPGACAHINAAEIDTLRAAISESAYILIQNETSFDANARIVAMAREEGAKVIYNPAPALDIPAEFLQGIDLVTPNEYEAEALSGIAVKDEPSAREAADWFKARGVENVLITLGERGVYVNWDDMDTVIPAFPAEALDTTGAGDAFNGALLCALSEETSKREAIAFAQAAAALAVERVGAATAMPSRDEILRVIQLREERK